MAVIIGAFIIGYQKSDNEAFAWLAFGISAIIAFCVLWYAPLYVTLEDGVLTISRLLRERKIPTDQIESIRFARPTIAERRICGSGGLFGYWGWFSQTDTGKYFAYYGKSSETFLLTLRNGKKYMVGCRDYAAMAEALREEAALYKA